MTDYTSDDQWRSLQTYVAAYLSGMVHARDIFTISRRESVSPPIVEFRHADDSHLWFAVGDKAWDDTEDARLLIPREGANEMAALTMDALRQAVDDPGQLRLSASGPASSVSVLARGGFFSGGQPQDVHPARLAAQAARMTASIDTEGDVIEDAAQIVGQRVSRALATALSPPKPRPANWHGCGPGSTRSAPHPKPVSWSEAVRPNRRDEMKKGFPTHRSGPGSPHFVRMAPHRSA